jgi:NTE family protein
MGRYRRVMGWEYLGVVLRRGRVIAFSALLVACAQIHNDPINLPLASASAELYPENAGDSGAETVVALSFSGGGTRAAAFAYGVLTGLNEVPAPRAVAAGSLLDHVQFVTGVSGGSVLAAYYGLKQRQALADFKERFLLRNAEANLQTGLNLFNIASGLEGGINDSTVFPRWLDDNLYDHATFGALLAHRPYIWINASDIYDRTPFVFGPAIFRALCSDVSSYPISSAVAASAAVPVVFAPTVIQGFPGQCPLPLPEWVGRVRHNPDAPPLLRLFANAMERYHSGAVRYVKLLDGGIVDNYGLAGFTIARLAAATPYGPLNPKQAVKLRRVLFLVVDAGRAPSGKWARTVEGPAGINLITAISDTATESGAVGSYSAFQDTMDKWQRELVNWRCGLSAGQRRDLAAPAGWNCRDVKIFVGRLAFEQLGVQRAAALNAVATRFTLPPDQVEMLIAAGRDALRASRVFNAFLTSIGSHRQRGPFVSDAADERAALAQ